MNAKWKNEYSHRGNKYDKGEPYSLPKVKQEILTDNEPENEDEYSDYYKEADPESDYYNEDYY